MASSASGQDKANHALWLATRAGKMEPSCLLGTTRCIPQAKFHQKLYNKSFIDQVCSVKMAGYCMASFFFCEFMDRDETRKKELGQYPAILTSHLVNNPYVFRFFRLTGLRSQQWILSSLGWAMYILRVSLNSSMLFGSARVSCCGTRTLAGYFLWKSSIGPPPQIKWSTTKG